MKTLSQLIDSLTLEDSQKYQATTDRLMWIETDLLDPAGLSRRHAPMKHHQHRQHYSPAAERAEARAAAGFDFLFYCSRRQLYIY
jgi:hypothetical protein